MEDGNSGGDEFDYLSTVKVLLGVKDDSLDNDLSMYISLTRESILTYCNIRELPSALNFTLCQMTADTYRESQGKNSVGSVSGNVSSVSEDGRTVSFSSGAEIRASIEDRISRTSELNRYRKLYRI